MSNNSSAMSMQELTMESAELLPGRETLCVTNCLPHGGGRTVGISQIGGGNTVQGGLLNVAALNGSNVLDGNNILDGVLNGLHI
jgi:hypothetical protein